MPTCCVAAGGNIGDVAATFREAWRMLSATPGIVELTASRPYRTIPVGENAGDVFLNAACRFETQVPAIEILARLRAIEEHFGRTRGVAWGPRTIDLDLILYGEQVIRLPQLSVPHPAAWYRRFVLDPLVEIAGELIHPVQRVSLQRLHARLLERPLKVALGPIEEEASDNATSPVRSQLQTEFPEIQLLTLDAAADADLVVTGTLGAYDLREGGWQRTWATRLVDSSERPARNLSEIRHILLSATDNPQPVDD
jgi:2-amino-4-hydroxy-6-hydroxymethyldihydropteridine diphosphokinase